MDRIKVIGMSCEHCRKAVETALGGLGLRDVKVELEGGAAYFSPDESVSVSAIKEAVEDAGFEVEF